jgi:hypothetical protein
MSTLVPCVGLARKECTMAGQTKTHEQHAAASAAARAVRDASIRGTQAAADARRPAPPAAAAPPEDRLGPAMTATVLDVAERAGVVTAATRPQWVTRLRADPMGAMDDLAVAATVGSSLAVRTRAGEISASAAVSTPAGGTYTHPAAVLAGVAQARSEARATEAAQAQVPAQIAQAAASLPPRPVPSLARALGTVSGRATSQPFGGATWVEMPVGWKP